MVTCFDMKVHLLTLLLSVTGINCLERHQARHRFHFYQSSSDNPELNKQVSYEWSDGEPEPEEIGHLVSSNFLPRQPFTSTRSPFGGFSDNSNNGMDFWRSIFAAPLSDPFENFHRYRIDSNNNWNGNDNYDEHFRTNSHCQPYPEPARQDFRANQNHQPYQRQRPAAVNNADFPTMRQRQPIQPPENLGRFNERPDIRNFFRTPPRPSTPQPSYTRFDDLDNVIQNAHNGGRILKVNAPVEFKKFPTSDDLNDDQGNNVDDPEEDDNPKDTRSVQQKQTKKLVNAALDAHNFYRQKHGSPDLTYSSEVAKVAQNWANNLISQGGKFYHRPNNKYGENLWMSQGRQLSDADAVKLAVDDWYNKEYNFYKPFFGKEPNFSQFSLWGHLTQILWKASRKVGVGVARKNRIVIVVANYEPRGNVMRHFAENVRPIGG